MARRRLCGIVFATAALFACGGAPDSQHPGIESAGTSEQAATVCARGTTLKGVDVSHYELGVDWVQVAGAGRSFGIAKATEGLTFHDSAFATNWAGMKRAGLVRGAYHFFRPADDGARQADFFLSAVGSFEAGDLPPILDWEVDDGVASQLIIRQAQAFIDQVRARTGLTTILYTSARVFDTLGNPSQFGGLPLWDANWQVACPNLPPSWSSWTFWQDSDRGVVPGINVPVDTNLFNGTLAELLALTGPSQSPDGGADAGQDGGAGDGGNPDAGNLDAGNLDAGNLDAGSSDPDAGSTPPIVKGGGGCATSNSSGKAATAVLLLIAGCAWRTRRRKRGTIR